MAAATVGQSDQYFNDFSSALRYWRGKRGYSQLHLSTVSEVSQRHISFLESGRAQPSKEMILKLGLTLEIPLRHRNVMLLAAGFAPAYLERRLSDPELGAVRRALDFMLAQQAPFPSLVVDRLWRLQLHNAPAAFLFRWLLDLPATQPIPGDGALNVLKLMLDPKGVRQHLVNWEEIAADLMTWIQREAMADGPEGEAGILLRELAAFPGINAGALAPNLDHRALPFLPVMIRKDGVELRLFTTITTLGTPHDVTVHELRIESFFPADEQTEAWFRNAAACS